MAGDNTILKGVKDLEHFEQTYGGEDKVVNDPAEITHNCAIAFAELPKDSQKLFLKQEDMFSQTRFFQDKIITGLISEIKEEKTIAAHNALSNILYYGYSEHPDEPPSFMTIDEGEKRSAGSVGSLMEYLSLKERSTGSDLSLMEYLFLNVNIGWHTVPVIITQDTLAKYNNPQIKVDGYIESAMIVADKGTDVSTESLASTEPIKPNTLKFIERSDAPGDVLYSYDAEESQRVSQDVLNISQDWPALVRDSFLVPLNSFDFYISQDFAGDNKGSIYVSEPLNTTSNIKMKIKDYTINFKHHGQKRLYEIGLEEPDGKIEYYFQGDETKFKNISGISDKIKAINRGIETSQKLLGDDPIQKVEFLDLMNGQAQADSHTMDHISFSMPFLKHSMKKLKETAEHETLHILIYKLGLSDSQDIMKHYVKELGGLPETIGFPGYRPNDEPHPFMSFITEENFFENEGGHPYSNIYEFCTSCVHSLMYPEKIAKNLKKESVEDQKGILLNFIELTALFRDASNGDIAQKFFEERRIQLKRLYDNLPND